MQVALALHRALPALARWQRPAPAAPHKAPEPHGICAAQAGARQEV
jgi:hypothetical protein